MLDGSNIKAARETIGQRLSRLRLDADLSMDELARKMGFAGQSSIQRYLAPNYDTELKPSLARKFQEALGMTETGIPISTGITPAIAKVLGLEEPSKLSSPHNAGLSPLAVLRTILCANPTAEQILAALAANGFGVVATAYIEKLENDISTLITGDPATEAQSVDDPKAYVLDVLKRHNLKPGALATKAGVQPSTLSRALNDPDHKFKFSVGTLQKIREWDRSQKDGISLK